MSLQQYFCLSLKNIRVQALELAKKEHDWEKLNEISDDLHSMSSENALFQPLNVAYMKDFRQGDTVATVVERAVQEAQTIHLPSLHKELGQGLVGCWCGLACARSFGNGFLDCGEA